MVGRKEPIASTVYYILMYTFFVHILVAPMAWHGMACALYRYNINSLPNCRSPTGSPIHYLIAIFHAFFCKLLLRSSSLRFLFPLDLVLVALRSASLEVCSVKE